MLRLITHIMSFIDTARASTAVTEHCVDLETVSTEREPLELGEGLQTTDVHEGVALQVQQHQIREVLHCTNLH